MISEGEGAKTYRERQVLLLPKRRRDVTVLKHGESFALCGARLKKLFGKSFLRIFKNFSAAVDFCFY